MKAIQEKQLLFDYIQEKFNLKSKDLNFRFPIETLDALLIKFFRENNNAAFLLKANKQIPNLGLKKVSKSFLLQLPLHNNSNENLYIGLSDTLSFLILFDEPNPENQNIKTQNSRLFLTFDLSIINFGFNFFYKHFCQALSIKEKQLLIKLKNAKKSGIDPYYVSKFQEELLISSLGNNNKLKQAKIMEAMSYTDEAIIITDLAGNIIEANRNYENYFGKQKKNNIRDLLAANSVDNALEVATKKCKWRSEINIKKFDNKEELLDVNCYLFKDELERPNGFVFIFKDITDLKKLDNINKQLIEKLRENNVQLVESNKRLLEADRIKNEMLSVVNHELKTPLSTILGFSELIEHRDYDGNTIKHYAEQITMSAKQLDRLVSDYLDVASDKFGVGNEKLYTMPVNLADLIRLSYQEQKSKFSNMQFDFNLDCLGYEPIIITEAQNIRKLFDNLINNSLKYSPNGGKLSIKILNDSENVTISIADQGIGLTPEQAKQVFEPFYRADNSITREFTGIGLGLALCKKIVEIYKGSIWCEPGTDLGTVFYITLPVNPHKLKQRTQETPEKLNVKDR